MTEQNAESAADRKPDTIVFVCPECHEDHEIANPRALLLAQHLDRYCPETEGVLHG
jgi:hypothetical protein